MRRRIQREGLSQRLPMLSFLEVGFRQTQTITTTSISHAISAHNGSFPRQLRHICTRMDSNIKFLALFLVICLLFESFFIQPIPIPIWFSLLLLSGQDSSQTCSKSNVQSHFYLPFAKTNACSPVQVQCTLKVRVYVLYIGHTNRFKIDLYYWNLIGYVICSKHCNKPPPNFVDFAEAYTYMWALTATIAALGFFLNIFMVLT
jgi:hypothetical protein